MHSSESEQAEKEPVFQALPRDIRLAIPICSALMLLIIGVTAASPKDIGTIFIPVFIFMVVVYVFSSIFLFKTILDKDQSAKEEH